MTVQTYRKRYGSNIIKLACLKYLYLSIYLSIYLSSYLPTYLPIYLVEVTTTQLCPDTVNQLSYKAMSPTCTQSTFIWEAKWTQTRMRFNFIWKSTLVFSHLFTCIHINWGKLVCISHGHFDWWNFKPVRFSWELSLPKAKWISTDFLDIAFHVHVHLKVIAGVISLQPFC